MDLRTGKYLWNARPLASCPLTHDLDVEIAIIGAGITGALIADQLNADGHSLIVLDKRPAASGSTLASTAIIQYELDISLDDLSRKIGWADAEYVFRSSFAAVQTLKDLAAGLPAAAALSARPALCLANTGADAAALQTELAARKRAGFAVEWFDAAEIRSRYPWSAAGGLYNTDSAELNPVEFALLLLERAVENGTRVFTGADVKRIAAGGRGIALHLANGATVTCRRAIVAAGYETYQWLPANSAKLTSSYAASTEPGQTVRGWEDRAVIWETARPYHYLRRTPDDRILVGGRDKPFRNALLRDFLLPYERFCLQRRLAALLGSTEHSLPLYWTGTFAESADSMPMIGERPDLSGVLFVFACGGNGTTFAAMARQLAVDWLAGRGHRLLRTFALNRRIT